MRGAHLGEQLFSVLLVPSSGYASGFPGTGNGVLFCGDLYRVKVDLVALVSFYFLWVTRLSSHRGVQMESNLVTVAV